MLKTRVIPTLLFKDLGLVKGISFDSWRRTGSIMQAIKVYNLRQVDELIFVDITATQENRPPDFKTIDEIADECFMPLTVGGGIKTIEDIKNLLRVGADRVAINTEAILRPEFIKEASEQFGSQCIVVSIDVKKEGDEYRTYINSGKKKTDVEPVSFAKKAEEMGAGEILLTSIDRDGTYKGYDVDIIKAVSGEISIPVIASGGAGNYNDMFLAISEGGASAVAAASIFHYTQQTPPEAKKFLKEKGIIVRC